LDGVKRGPAPAVSRQVSRQIMPGLIGAQVLCADQLRELISCTNWISYKN
jgi:hypothetical protein